MIIVLIILLAMAAIGKGIGLVAAVVVGAVVPAVLIDAVILRLKKTHWVFPDGALLTGLFIAMILSPYQRWQVAAVTAVLGIVTKYVFRVRTANVFNPAAIALVGTFYIFNTGQSWWGALPELPPLAVLALFVTGLYITQRVNKLPSVLAFLGAYYVLVTASAFIGDPGRVAGLYRAPELHAALFFAFFMVTDPPTSPPKRRDQTIFGVIVAVTAYAFFSIVHSAYFLLAGLLIGNVWEAWRRWNERRRKVAFAH
jgi:Na+-translocating ferredoxin:NAD+ oxidoreductase RnfD subunit